MVPIASGKFLVYEGAYQVKTEDMWKIGPSGVRALPLAAGINVGGHYKWHFVLFFFLSFSPGSLLILPEGVVLGIQIFACGPELPIE